MLLSRDRPASLSDEVADAVGRLEDDVRVSLTGIAARRAEVLTRTAGARYRAAIVESGALVWQRFAAALDAALRAAADAPPESVSDDARAARTRLHAFLAENPDLGRNRAFARPG